MRKTSVLVCLIISVPLAGSLRRSTLGFAVSSEKSSHIPELRFLSKEIFRLHASGQYLAALNAAEKGYSGALALHEDDLAISFSNNSGGMQIALFQYKQALEAFLAARRIAESSGKAAWLAPN